MTFVSDAFWEAMQAEGVRGFADPVRIEEVDTPEGAAPAVALPPRSPVGGKGSHVNQVESVLGPVSAEIRQWTSFAWDHKTDSEPGVAFPEDLEVAPCRATADAEFVRLPHDKRNLMFHANTQSGKCMDRPGRACAAPP